MLSTAVRDERGRLRIRDETTGETILVRYRYAGNTEQDAAVNRIVVATGTVTGAGTDRQMLHVERYDSEREHRHPRQPTTRPETAHRRHSR